MFLPLPSPALAFPIPRSNYPSGQLGEQALSDGLDGAVTRPARRSRLSIQPSFIAPSVSPPAGSRPSGARAAHLALATLRFEHNGCQFVENWLSLPIAMFVKTILSGAVNSCKTPSLAAIVFPFLKLLQITQAIELPSLSSSIFCPLRLSRPRPGSLRDGQRDRFSPFALGFED